MHGHIDQLKHHFKKLHKLNFKYGRSFCNFECAQPNCQAKYNFYNNFRSHMIKHHPSTVSLNKVSQFDQSVAVESENQTHIKELNIASKTNSTVKSLKQKLLNNVNETICEMRANVTLNESLFETVLEYFQKIISDVSQFYDTIIKESTEFVYPESPTNILYNLLTEVNTFSKQAKLLKESMNDYADPKTILLGYRTDTAIQNAENIAKSVPETFQYIPITKTLTCLIKNEDVRNLIESEKISPDEESSQIKNYTDGVQYKKSNYFQRYSNALRIILYYDDIEVVNPIGSKTSIHKLGIFYFTLQNFPLHISTSSENIFILLICYANDIKKYGFKEILGPFIADMHLLEHDDGIEVSLLNGEMYVLRAVLIGFTGDTLAAHDIFEHLSPSADCFCRTCMVSRKDIRNDMLTGSKTNFIIRNPNLHKQQLEEIFNDKDKIKLFGIRCDSVLNELRIFHTTENFIFDVMHDLLEGVIPMEIKWCLHAFIKKKYFTVKYLNEQIAHFKYGFHEKSNKPTPNFTNEMITNNQNNIKQKAIQTWLLLRTLPYMIIDKIPEHDLIYIDLLVSLLKITEMSFSNSFNEYRLAYLDHQINYNEKLFNKLFPEVNTINKHHHIKHYVKCITEKGPLVLYSCLRYENKHLPFKKHASNTQNFKNLPKTLIKCSSLFQNYNINKQSFSDTNIVVLSSKEISIEKCKSKKFILEIGHILNTYKISTLTFNTYKYKENVFVVIDENEFIYTNFLKIEEMIQLNDEVCIYGSVIRPVELDEQLYAFKIIMESNDEKRFKNSLTTSKPCSVWKKSGSDDYFVSIHHFF